MIEAGMGIDELEGLQICLKSNGYEGHYIVFFLRIEKPLVHEGLYLLVHSGRQWEMYSETEALKVLRTEVLQRSMVRLPPISALEVFDLLREHVSVLQNEVNVLFDRELSQLNQYYRELFQEISTRKQSLYYHTYYFEREQQLIQEELRARQEMQEQGELLLARFSPQSELKLLMFGEMIRDI